MLGPQISARDQRGLPAHCRWLKKGYFSPGKCTYLIPSDSLGAFCDSNLFFHFSTAETQRVSGLIQAIHPSNKNIYWGRKGLNHIHSRIYFLLRKWLEFLYYYFCTPSTKSVAFIKWLLWLFSFLFTISTTNSSCQNTDRSDIRDAAHVSHFSRIPNLLGSSITPYMVQLQTPALQQSYSFPLRAASAEISFEKASFLVSFHHFSASGPSSRPLPHLLAEELVSCGVDGVVHAADGLTQRRGHKRVPAAPHVRGCPKHKETTKHPQFASIFMGPPSSWKSVQQLWLQWPRCRTNSISVCNINTINLFYLFWRMGTAWKREWIFQERSVGTHFLLYSFAKKCLFWLVGKLQKENVKITVS